jgi:hypothetical protein
MCNHRTSLQPPAIDQRNSAVVPNYKGYYYVEWITIRNDIEYFIAFQTIPADHTALAYSLTAMINSWHWNASGS